MEINSNERTNNYVHKNEDRRQYIINNYKEFIPDIEDYIYERKNPKFDYRFLNNDYKEARVQKRYGELSNIIVDIRNNTSATNYYSNSINKTDNKYSNETKKLVKHLIGKGWNNNEIAYEIEKVYGSGAVTWHKGLDREATVSSIVFNSSIKLCCLFMTYKLGKMMILKLKNNKGLFKFTN